jgi:protein SCO1/2
LLLNSAAAMIRTLTPAERGRLRVLMVSLDPARDNAARLAQLAQLAREHRLDSAQWTLASADVQLTRRLAAVLDIRYRQLAGGDFNHTAALTLLDADGRIVARTENIGATPDAEFLAALQRTLRMQ